MAKKYPDKTLLVLDHGLFFDFALKLADDFKQVYYYVAWERSDSEMHMGCIGKEFKNGIVLDTFDGKRFKRVDSPFEVINEIDVVCSLDLYFGFLIETLRESGIPCFGAGTGEILEQDRLLMSKELLKVGLDSPKIKSIIGMTDLKEYLKNNNDKYIKISKYRATFETFHHETYELSEPLLDHIAVLLGPLKEVAEFLVCDPIEALFEEGVDTFCINGKLPTAMMQGCEIKGESYCCSIFNVEDLSKGNQRVNKGLSEILGKYGYNGFFSSEVRTTKDGKNYMIDLCARLGMPPNAIMQEYYDNIAEIIWEGANGNIVNPTSKYKYGLEALISTEWYTGNHRAIYFPEELRNNVKLLNCVKIDGNYYVMKVCDSLTIGSIVYPCNDLEEGKKALIKIAEQIKGYDLNIKTDSLDAAIEEYNKMINQK